jgi:O-methyltransferase
MGSKEILKRLVRQSGFDVVRYPPPAEFAIPADIPPDDRKILATVKPFTWTSYERLAALVSSVRFHSRNDLKGAIAECGVWKGGSMMAVALTLIDEGDTGRDLYLYDTYEGMSEPTAEDVSFDGELAAKILDKTPKGQGFWCYSSLEEVAENIRSTGYPMDRVHFIKGMVEETIPHQNPPALALLRLDTDWYESTKHELKHLFPLLAEGGTLIIDDYGHWQGARKAVDEFLEALPEKYFLHRIDATGRMLIK